MDTIAGTAATAAPAAASTAAVAIITVITGGGGRLQISFATDSQRVSYQIQRVGFTCIVFKRRRRNRRRNRTAMFM